MFVVFFHLYIQIVIYYTDTMRDYNDIVEIRKEEDVIYLMENYIEKNNYMIQLN